MQRKAKSRIFTILALFIIFITANVVHAYCVTTAACAEKQLYKSNQVYGSYGRIEVDESTLTGDTVDHYIAMWKNQNATQGERYIVWGRRYFGGTAEPISRYEFAAWKKGNGNTFSWTNPNPPSGLYSDYAIQWDPVNQGNWLFVNGLAVQFIPKTQSFTVADFSYAGTWSTYYGDARNTEFTNLRWLMKAGPGNFGYVQWDLASQSVRVQYHPCFIWLGFSVNSFLTDCDGI